MAIERVKTYFRKYGMEEKIQEFDVSSATVELAAAALHCEPCRIAKTLSFLVEGHAILVVAAGDAKIDNPKYKEQFGTKAKMLSPDEVEALVGHAVGGVCPFAVNEGVKVYLDVSLKRFKTVFPACGSSNSAIELTIPKLEEHSGYMGWVDVCKGYSRRLLLFDLDGTLLRSDKTISERTLKALRRCREKGILIGVSTSRSEQNALSFIEELQPDILIASGGAVVKYDGEYLYKVAFSAEETRQMIAAAREVCGTDCEITVDTLDAHYWNYKVDPKKQDQSWGDSIYTDFEDFNESSLKICVEIFEEHQAECLKERFADCDCIRFSDGYWYKFTKKAATKERAILEIGTVCGIKTEDMCAFGDDYADIGMLELCGIGIAMGNAIEEVRKKADLIIGSNDEDGIAEYLERE